MTILPESISWIWVTIAHYCPGQYPSRLRTKALILAFKWTIIDDYVRGNPENEKVILVRFDR